MAFLNFTPFSIRVISDQQLLERAAYLEKHLTQASDEYELRKIRKELYLRGLKNEP